MSSFFLLSSFLSFSPVLSDQASITQMAAVTATCPRWVGAGAGLTIPAPFGHLRATASRPGAIRPVVSRRKVGLHLSSPPLGAALSPQPETLQSALPSLNMGGWIFHGWPRGGRLAKDLTTVERETPGEQTGQLVPELSPHGADTWAPRLGARANEAFVGALSTQAHGGWRHTPDDMPAYTMLRRPAEKGRGQQWGRKRVCQTSAGCLGSFHTLDPGFWWEAGE